MGMREIFVRGGSGVQGSLRQVHGALEAIALMLEIVGILGILATYGPTFTGVVVIFFYVVGWKVVGAVFDQIGYRIPRPLKILWEIFEDIIGILA